MITPLQRERMELARLTTRETETNCVGTLLYVLGLVNKDKYVDEDHLEWKYFLNLLRISNLTQPTPGAIAVISSAPLSPAYHVGLVAGSNPTIIFHRYGVKGPILEQGPLDFIERFGLNRSPFYYLPHLE
ncbi:hypothetical protein HYV86_01155 [Candidatus Woesearchaeota archaeon]|nr:hypothetical protein [Candidatus Woesearchaeota archaeon]